LLGIDNFKLLSFRIACKLSGKDYFLQARTDIWLQQKLFGLTCTRGEIYKWGRSATKRPKGRARPFILRSAFSATSAIND
jgi:hypothetical protein